MTENQQTLTPGVESSTNAEGAEASAPQPISEFYSDGELTSTVESQIPKVDVNSESAEQNTPSAEKTGGKAGESDPGKDGDGSGDDRLDKHPRFKELIDEKNALKTHLAELKGRLDGMGQQPGKDEASAPKRDYEDVTAMDDNEILDSFNENPKGFLSNFAKQIQAEVREAVTSELSADFNQRSYEDQVASTFQAYADKTPGFQEMWDSGKIEAFMKQNPGHNAISAHQLLTAGDNEASVQQQIDEAVAKAVKETEEKLIKNVKAKQGAVTLSSGPSANRGTETVAPELKDPKKFGGVTNVLTQRLQARRMAGQV